MTAKLLFFRDFARAAQASRTRANAYSRSAAPRPDSGAPAAARYVPHVRPRAECRWLVDPATGALRAHWQRPCADRGAGSTASDIIDGQGHLRPPLAAAGDPGALRPAA